MHVAYEDWKHHIHWPHALSHLGIQNVPPALPYSLACPLCKTGTMTIYNDDLNCAVWCHCSGCQGYGDIIELVSQATGDSIARVVSQLTTTGWADSSDYEARYPLRRRTVDQFWQEAQERLIKTRHALWSLRLHLDFASFEWPGCWRAYGGRPLGAATRDQIAALITPRDIDRLLPGPRGRPKPMNKPWREALVLPFFDLPGRISAFAFAVRSGFGTDVAYVGAAAAKANSTALWEPPPGIAAMPALFQPPGSFRDTVFVLLDPLVAVRLQVKLLGSCTKAAVVGVWPTAPVAEFLREQGRSRRMIVWGALTPDLFRYARPTTAWVAPDTAVHEEIYKQLRRYPPEEWLSKTERTAKPWQEVLQAHLTTLNVTAAQAFLRRVALGEEELNEFIETCAPDLRNRLEPLRTVKTGGVIVDGRRIIETDQGWELVKTKEVICGASLHIKETLCTPNEQVYYRGHVRHCGEDVPFLAPAAELEERPFAYMHRLLRDRGRGLLAFNPRWQQHAYNIAIQLHPPGWKPGADRYGFDVTNRRWVFPDFFIDEKGEVVNECVAMPENGLTPSVTFQPPTIMPLHADSLSTGPQAELAWAVAVCVLHNLLSPFFNNRPLGTVITGPIAEPSRKLARALGCPTLQLTSRGQFQPSHRAQIEKVQACSSWPIILEFPRKRRQPLSRWFSEEVASNLIVEADRAHAALGVISGNWLRLEGTAPLDMSRDTLTAATNLIPHFLQWFMRERPWHYWGNDPVERLWVLLEEWFQSEQGGLEALRNARQLLTSNSPASMAEAFLELIYRLHQQGLLGFARKGYEEAPSSRRRRPEVSIVYLPEEKLLWIPAKVNGILQENSWPTLDNDHVSQHLQHVGVLSAERQILDEGAKSHPFGYELGWCVPEKEWDRRLPVWRSRYQEDSNSPFDAQAV